MDVNSDTILEMPRPHLLPTYGENLSSDFWLIDWSQYDVGGRAAQSYHLSQYVRSVVSDHPEEWVDQITISRSDSSGIRAVIFSLWNGRRRLPPRFWPSTS